MNTTDADIILETATEFLLSGQYQAAESLVAEVLAQHPEHWPALRVAAMVAQRRGRFADAFEFAHRAIARTPDDTVLLNVSANASRALGRLEESEQTLRRALQIAPGIAETHLNLALTLLDLGERAKAETFFKNVTLLRSDSERAHFHLGQIYQEDGRPGEAIAELRKALHISPGNAAARKVLADSLLAIGRTTEAYAELEFIAEESPQQADGRIAAAHLAFELAYEARAIEHLMAAESLESPSVVSPKRPLIANLGLIDLWCESHGSGYQRVSRSQWLRYGRPTAIPESDTNLFDLPRPFSRELFVASLAKARVLPGELHVITSDNQLLIEGLVNNGQKRVHKSKFISRVADDGRVLMSIPIRQISVDGPVCLLGSAPDHFSWVYECLSRLWVLEQRPSLDGLPILVAEGLSPWQRNLLELLGVEGNRRMEVSSASVLECAFLHVPAVPAVGWFVAPMAIEFLRRSLRKIRSERPGRERRLYLSREGLNGRNVVNEDEILPLLERHGIERIVPGNMSMAELLACLAEAEVVIGAEGSPMAHLFMLPSGASVGMFCTRGLQQPRYYCATAPLGLNFTYLVVEPEFDSHEELAECNICVKPELLNTFLESIRPRR